MAKARAVQFEAFFADAEPRLRRALGRDVEPQDAADAVAHALAWAWEHWDEVRGFDNPVGYLYRVGQSAQRRRRTGLLPAVDSHIPAVEPGLPAAMRALPERQRTAVWLVVACGFTHAEAAEAMTITRSAVGNHVGRGLAALRVALGHIPEEGV